MSQSQLSRRLSRPVLLFYGLGTILGAGIYVLIGEVAGAAGPLALWSFLLAGTLAAITAISYSALAPAFPEAGGEAVYVQEAFGTRWWTTTVGLLLALTGIVSAGVLAGGFERYASELVDLPSGLTIALVMVVLGVLAGIGVEIAAGVAVGITLIEIAGLLIVVALTHRAWLALPEQWPNLWIPADTTDWLGIGTGTVLAFYAFIGFEDMVNMAEEARDPSRDLPFAIFGSLLLAALFYVVVGAAALLSLGADALAEARAPLAAVVRVHGGPGWLISVISLVAVLNGALVQIVMASRVLYGLARRGALPAWFGEVNRRTRAPARAAAVAALVTLAFALALPLDRLAEITSLALLAVFASIHAALLKLRPVRQRAGLSIFWPVLGLVSCAGVIVFRIVRYVV